MHGQTFKTTLSEGREHFGDAGLACEYSRLSALRPLAAFGPKAASGRSAERRLYSQANAGCVSIPSNETYVRVFGLSQLVLSGVVVSYLLFRYR